MCLEGFISFGQIFDQVYIRMPDFCFCTNLPVVKFCFPSVKELQVIAYFFIVVTKHLDKCNLRKDGLILAYVSRVQSTW